MELLTPTSDVFPLIDGSLMRLAWVDAFIVADGSNATNRVDVEARRGNERFIVESLHWDGTEADHQVKLGFAKTKISELMRLGHP